MKIANVSKTYKTKYETVHALEEVNLNLPSTGMVFIVGVSGSGKSTLMNILSGIDKPTNGNVLIGGEPLFREKQDNMFGYRNSYVGLIFQDYNLIEDLNVYDNIKLSLELMDKANFEIVDEVIKLVDIEEIKYSNVNEISSGQMQRVAIARTLVKDSSIILADEPTGNLDSKNEKIVFDLLKEISKDRLVLVITHDDDAANYYSDRIIRIEDGNITEDNSPLNEDDSIKAPEFIEPTLRFKQQARFTKGFIKNNFTRSLSIFLIMLLIPIIGGILASYAFFDVAQSYRLYQDQYNSNYVMLSKRHNDTDIYYTSDDWNRISLEYPGSTMLEQYDTWIDVNPFNISKDSFYQPEINSIIIFSNKLNLIGSAPQEDNEIVVTDYVLSSIKHYQDKDEVNSIEIDGFVYKIVGIVDTDYENFIDADFSNVYIKSAFEENLNIYNAIYISHFGYFKISDNMTSYREQISFEVRKDGSINTKYANVIVTKNKGQSLLAGRYPNQREALVSNSFYFDVMGLGLDQILESQRYVFYTHTKARYSIAPTLSGVFQDDDYIIVLNENDFNNYKNKLYYGRIIIFKDDVNYEKIVKNENVTNQSFEHANSMWLKTRESQIVMFEFLIVLILIMATFSILINSMTVRTEKKKIGIKYSFGLRKLAIVIPYIFELILYISISFVASIIVVKYLFPFFMKNIIYTSIADKRAFDFFYVAWSTILGWNVLIYAIMLGSLTWMIIKILAKSPIEIIKDL